MSPSMTHESAPLHVQGLATYIDDLPLIEGTLHAAPILSQKARGRITSLDVSAVRSSEGVVAVVSADDIPGDRLLATFVHDEPVFATDEVQHIGQVLGLVVADSHVNARAAASKKLASRIAWLGATANRATKLWSWFTRGGGAGSSIEIAIPRAIASMRRSLRENIRPA